MKTESLAGDRRNIRLVVAYDGTDFHGWQRQPSLPTVQGQLEETIARLCQEPITLYGSGRTDAGVHALAQVANFTTSCRIPCINVVKALNALLPLAVRVRAASEAPPEFHARFDVRSKTYRYRMVRAAVCLPFISRFAWHYDYPLDLARMAEAAWTFLGEHDFTSLAASQSVTTFKPGRYYFYEDEGSPKALAVLRDDPAEQIPDQTLLLPPGLTLDKIAARIGALKNKSASRFLEVANQGTVRSKFEPNGVSSLEGLTWPDTYSIGATETETQILQRIVAQFDKKAAEAGLGGPEADPYDAMKIASMVQTEAGTNNDMPLIAAVLWNRIRKGMPLQVDATLCYAKHGCPPVPTDADKKIDSPYNTYKVLGLPPTPIATVSQNAIQAALHPATVDYLYYVSDKNGKTYYASTLADQERNIARAKAAG